MEILSARQDAKQEVNAISLDLGKPAEVRTTLQLKPILCRRRIADVEDRLMRPLDVELEFQMFCIVWPAVTRQRWDSLQTLTPGNWKVACETTISPRHTPHSLCLRFGRKMTKTSRC